MVTYDLPVEAFPPGPASVEGAEPCLASILGDGRARGLTRRTGKRWTGRRKRQAPPRSSLQALPGFWPAWKRPLLPTASDPRSDGYNPEPTEVLALLDDWTAPATPGAYPDGEVTVVA